MSKLENVVLASPEQMEFIIQGMRNPMNSWGRSDSTFIEEGEFMIFLEILVRRSEKKIDLN